MDIMKNIPNIPNIPRHWPRAEQEQTLFKRSVVGFGGVSII